jgi:hypothetical protein
MKTLTRLAATLFIISCLVCMKNAASSQEKTDVEILREDAALEKIAGEILKKSDVLKNKKIAVFYFSNLEGKETPDGKRLSHKLLENLLKNSSLTFIERSELDKLLQAKGIEQTGIVDVSVMDETEKVLPLDIMVSGIIAQIKDYGELTVKAVSISTGQIQMMSSVAFRPRDPFTYRENNEKLKLHKSSPDTLEMMNNAYNTLAVLSDKRPLIFLLAVTEKNDPALKDHPNAEKKLAHNLIKIKMNNPALLERLKRLRNGIQELKKNDPVRYGEIENKKTALIKSINDKKSYKLRSNAR